MLETGHHGYQIAQHLSDKNSPVAEHSDMATTQVFIEPL